LARGLRTHCIYGHPLFGENLYETSKGVRQCRICRKERDRMRGPRPKMRPSDDHGEIT
jgi:hypothetical protein